MYEIYDMTVITTSEPSSYSTKHGVMRNAPPQSSISILADPELRRKEQAISLIGLGPYVDLVHSRYTVALVLLWTKRTRDLGLTSRDLRKLAFTLTSSLPDCHSALVPRAMTRTMSTQSCRPRQHFPTMSSDPRQRNDSDR